MRFPLLLSALLATSALLAQAKEPPKEPAKDHPSKEAAKGAVDFEKQILPILEKSCVECHSPKNEGGRMRRPKGGMNLESKDSMLASKNKSGSFLVAKKPEESMLYKAISAAADAEGRMPPAKKGEPLPKEQQELIKKWITEGASFGKWVGKKADDKKPDEKGADGGDKPKGKEGGDKPGEKPKSGG